MLAYIPLSGNLYLVNESLSQTANLWYIFFFAGLYGDNGILPARLVVGKSKLLIKYLNIEVNTKFKMLNLFNRIWWTWQRSF